MKRLSLFTILACSLFLNTATAQTCPGFPQRGAEIIDSLAARHPGGALGGSEEQRRELTKQIIEQLVFEFPQDGWVWKAQSPTHPPSKDTIARQVNGRLCYYDWQNGGTRQRSIQPGQVSGDATGQWPITLAGVNHLGASPNVGGVMPEPGTSADLDALLALIGEHDTTTREAISNIYNQNERTFANLTAQIQQIAERLEALAAQPTRVPPTSDVVTPGRTWPSLLKYAGVIAGSVVATALGMR